MVIKIAFVTLLSIVMFVIVHARNVEVEHSDSIGSKVTGQQPVLHVSQLCSQE